MPHTPNKPSGSDSEAVFMQSVWERIFGKSSKILSVPGKLDVSYTEQGIILDIKIRPGAAVKGKTIDANYKPMIIVGLGSALIPARPDLLVCKAFDLASQTASGADIYVAKDPEARRNTKEYYADNGDNVTVSYTYFSATASDASYGDNFRMANDGTDNELQVMEKRYYTQAMMPAGIPLTQAVILVVDLGTATGVTDPTGASVTRIEVKPVRVWIRVITQ